MSLKLGELLLTKKAISLAQLNEALETQKQVSGKLGSILVMLGFLTEDQLCSLVAEQIKLPLFQLKDLMVHPNVSALADVELLEKHQLLPIRRTGDDGLLVAMVDPLDYEALDQIKFVTGLRIEQAVASRSNIQQAIGYYFHGQPCPEIESAEKSTGGGSGKLTDRPSGMHASPQAVLQALTELLIEKKVIAQSELLAKLAGKGARI